MRLYRNVADQEVFFALVNAATGAAVAGATVTVWITQNTGAQVAGAGTIDDLGHGQYRYRFTQGETDAESVGLLLLATGCVPVPFSWTTTAGTTPGEGTGEPGALLVSLETAQRHLRLPVTEGSPSDAESDLLLKIGQASSIVRAYVDRPSDATWTATVAGWTDATVPAIVQAAVLLQLAVLYQHRGDETTGAVDAGAVAPEAAMLLRATGYRDPVVV